MTNYLKHKPSLIIYLISITLSTNNQQQLKTNN